MRRRPARLLAALVAGIALTGCSEAELASHRVPACDVTGDPTTFLMAQAVPGATLLPCVERDRLPRSWWFADLEVDDLGAEFAFVGDRLGTSPSQVVVRFGASCGPTDQVVVPSDEAGTERVNRGIGPSGRVYEWGYRFPGGCVTYAVTAADDVWGRFVADVERALGFVARDEVVERHDAVLGR